MVVTLKMINVPILIIACWFAFIAGYMMDKELPAISPIRAMEGMFCVMSVFGISIAIILSFYVFIGKPFGLFFFF